MADDRNDEWIRLADLPWSRVTSYRLAKACLLHIQRIDRRAAVLQSEVNGILAGLRAAKGVPPCGCQPIKPKGKRQ